MSRLAQITLAGALALSLGSATTLIAHQNAPLTAKATIAGDGITGTATLREVPSRVGASDPQFPTGSMAVEITVQVTGLKPGPHGIHLHAVGKCEAPGFTSAGGHFDPGPNGMMDPDMNHPFHMGDMPNIVADAKGAAKWVFTTTRVTVGAGPLSIFDEDGTAIIIHANPDQGVTAEAKAGLSGGPRAACGVLTK
jgi:Cu-Zn family superoxide dismutase